MQTNNLEIGILVSYTLINVNYPILKENVLIGLRFGYRGEEKS